MKEKLSKLTQEQATTSPELVKTLNDRAYMLSQARAFFAERKICEVDCPILSPYASIDTYIDLIPATPKMGPAYLHSSPEYGMKRLLAKGMGDIYQLSHVFRDGEVGFKHNPEFMMAEWYRLGIEYMSMIEETLNFVRLFIGDLPSETITYREAFRKYAGFDYTKMTKEELLPLVEAYEDITKEELLNIILATKVEPNLGKGKLLVLNEYPASQAALAKTFEKEGIQVAERFEVYFEGLELANGYHELTDAVEQKRRFIEDNKARIALGKEALPEDSNFLKALEKGIPGCCGVAVGFDRLMMLRHKAESIGEVIPFSYDRA